MQSQHPLSSNSFWTDNTSTRADYHSLKGKVEADVAIIGGGITGMIAALQLTVAGKKVVILEADRIAGSTTGFSTGNLYVPLQTKYHKILSDFGKDTVEIIARSRMEAIDFVERTIRENVIDCQFHRRPWYMYTNNPQNVSIVQDEVKALKNAGMEIDFVEDMPLNVKYLKAAKMENQARFNPYKFVTELARILSQQGCLIYEYSPVVRYEENDVCTLFTRYGKAAAEYMIEATHIPKGINMVDTLVYPHRSYVVAAQINEPYPDGNFWDMDKEPAHAISSHGIKSDNLEMLMFAGNHHKTGQSDKLYMHHYLEIEEFIDKTYPGAEIKYHWSAQHYTPADGVAYIGKGGMGSDKRYMATGFAADGLTYGVVAGIIISNMITGYDNPWLAAYDSTRIKPISSSKEFVMENINVAMQYIKDYPRFGEVESFSEIDKLEGRTLQLNGEKLAAYRDGEGEMHVHSAICPHMKCVINWNDAEKTWDCPCHGSRFSINGEVIEGPSLEPLEKKDVGKEMT
ncbi:MAG: FAD-dependent oxidoreductase [Balneolales bacterium]